MQFQDGINQYTRSQVEHKDDTVKTHLLLGRVYFLAIIPFAGAVLAPWVFGPAGNHHGTTFVLWSFTVLLFASAANVGYAVGQNEKLLYLHGLVSVVLAAIGIACVLLAMSARLPFASVAVLTVLHWLSWLWMQKSRTLTPAFFKQHNRFVWTALACHMLVLLNLIYAARTG